ncbi:hypothetical protein [Williamsia sp. 1138]|uniref:hypothetical protein n=1 Tax=Williamsia sp. 1138 TaxID=1903117 RepID=UPI00117C21DA|nr:hypothetical protein [Williamsia sp. 1138]
MSSSIDEHLQAIADAGRRCREAALQTHRADLGEVHQADSDIALWLSRLSGPTISQLEAARRELALAEYSISSGLYRQAYSSLRLFLELSFASIHFSVNEFERRQWISDRTDFSWSGALSADDGVLSKPFVREFAPQLTEVAAEYSHHALENYRYCSQFVHGKDRISRQLPEAIEPAPGLVIDWCNRATSSARVVLFLLYVRYGQDLEANSDSVLQQTIIAHFGHVPAVRQVLHMTGD